MPIRTLVLSSLFALSAMAAQAQSIAAADPDSVSGFLAHMGVEPEVTTDNQGDPLIKVSDRGFQFSIYFYGCSDNRNCTSVQFYSGYKTEGSVSLEKINEWNTNRRFARAYLTDAGSARIEYDVYTGKSGIQAGDFSGLYGEWMEAIARFEAHIDW